MKTSTKQLIQSLFLCIGFTLMSQNNSTPSTIDHVLHISVDGLRPDIITSLGASIVPNFFRFRTEGAWTDNARTDFLNTSTIPGHTSHITGRPVFGNNGHGFWWNSDPGPFTLHTSGYITSVFDVVHDNGLSTALYAGKDKFVLFENSYNENTGAPDTTGTNNGRDKIDTYVYNGDMDALFADFISDYSESQYNYALFHFRNPDSQGHSTGWELNEESGYAQKVKEIDALLGQVFQVVETIPGLAGRTAIILTADHGGRLGGDNHGNVFDPDNYTIPFYVWGPGVTAGADLYALNTDVRKNPGTGQPDDSGSLLPIRYGEVANLVLDFLELPSVSGSFFNQDQSLKVSVPQSSKMLIVQEGLNGYSGTKDTYIKRDKSSNNYGERDKLVVDDADPWWSGRDVQSLLEFSELIGSQSNQIPSGSNIEEATLYLRVFNEGNGGSFHRMLKPWEESTTWNSVNKGISANDLEAVQTPDAVVNNVKKGMLPIDVTSSVQAWANGETNNGWVILPDGGNGWDFYSSEGFFEPKLVITYNQNKANNDKNKTQKEVEETIVDQETEKITETEEASYLKPRLLGNFPNPFTNKTTIGFIVPEEQEVSLTIYDLNGQLVATLAKDIFAAGQHEIIYYPESLQQGIYIVNLKAAGRNGNISESKKVVYKP